MKWCKDTWIDDDTDCDDINEGGDYSYSYSGPGVLCPGYDKDDFCDCDGDCTENPKWCSCPKAVDCCSRVTVTTRRSVVPRAPRTSLLLYPRAL